MTEIRVLKELHSLIENGETLSRVSKTVAKLSGWKKGNVYRLGIKE